MKNRKGEDSLVQKQKRTGAEIVKGARERVAENLAASPIQDEIAAGSAKVRALRMMSFLDSEEMPAILGNIMATCRQLLEQQLKGTGHTVGRLQMWLVGGRTNPKGQIIKAGTDLDFIITVDGETSWITQEFHHRPEKTMQETAFANYIEALNERLSKKMGRRFLNVSELSSIISDEAFRKESNNAHAILFAMEHQI